MDGMIPCHPERAKPLACLCRACAVWTSAFRSKAVWRQRARLHRSPPAPVDAASRLSAAVVGTSRTVSAVADGAVCGGVICPAAGVEATAGRASARSTSVQFLPRFIRHSPVTVRSDGRCRATRSIRSIYRDSFQPVPALSLQPGQERADEERRQDDKDPKAEALLREDAHPNRRDRGGPEQQRIAQRVEEAPREAWVFAEEVPQSEPHVERSPPQSKARSNREIDDADHRAVRCDA